VIPSRRRLAGHQTDRHAPRAPTPPAALVKVNGAAQAQYRFTNHDAPITRQKLLVHDSFGPACGWRARRLHQGYFVWPHSTSTLAPGAPRHHQP
jgi:hypothetical protein